MNESISGTLFGRWHSVAMLLALTATGARAELVDISWDGSGHFETSMSVAPGKFAEVCGKLAKGQSIAWSFKADKPMNFNVHYHEGKQAVFPEKQEGVVQTQGTLEVGVDQHYCWMWTNKSDAPAQLRLSLQR